MYIYNKAKIPLNNEQTPKQQRTTMKNNTKGRGRVKKGSKEDIYG
jgi:hypothetical protein